ncbi:hypothetical protein [Spirosoma arcticum]
MNSVIRYVTGFAGMLLLLVGLAKAQPGAVVSNVRAEVDSQRIKINYDLVGIGAADSVYVQVESRSAGTLPANSVTGDVGRVVSPGTAKTIYWDYRLDGVSITDDIRATVLVKQGATPPGGLPGAVALPTRCCRRWHPAWERSLCSLIKK